MRRRNSGDIWFFLIIFFLFGGSGVLFPLIIMAGFFYFIYSIVKAANKTVNMNNQRETINSYGYSERRRGNTHTASDLARINVFLRNYYKSHTKLDMPNNIQLVVRTDKFSTLNNLDVYRDGTRIGTLNEFRNRYMDLYSSMFDTLLAMAKNSQTTMEAQVVDAEIVDQPAKPKPVKEEKPKPQEKRSQYFMEQISNLNANIPDEAISNGLYETAALLKQIQMLEGKFPDQAKKMDKMYGHYLPYLVRILSSYENLQTVKSDVNYERNVEQLKSTIHSINEALNNIIPSMSDSDFTNLSADMATLEALLQKDGLTGGMEMSEPLTFSNESTPKKE